MLTSPCCIPAYIQNPVLLEKYVNVSMNINELCFEYVIVWAQ